MGPGVVRAWGIDGKLITPHPQHISMCRCFSLLRPSMALAQRACSACLQAMGVHCGQRLSVHWWKATFSPVPLEPPPLALLGTAFFDIWEYEQGFALFFTRKSSKPEVSRASVDWAWGVQLYQEAPPRDFQAPPTGHVVAASLRAPSAGLTSVLNMLGARRLCPQQLGPAGTALLPLGVSGSLFSTAHSLPVGLFCCCLWPFLAQVVHPIASFLLPPSNAQDPCWPIWASADDGPVIFTISPLSTSCFVTWDKPQPQFSHL